MAPSLHISINRQLLTLIDDQGRHCRFSISTATQGAGEQKNSGCTPRGLHYVRACIGGGQAINSVFVGRRFTGEVYSEALAERFPKRDWILTRILWLSGLELGVNRLGNVDTMQRYVYIHGTPDTEPMGVPASHGCIRMRNDELVELFNKVPVGTRVVIEE